jgi:hypothetical protein
MRNQLLAIAIATVFATAITTSVMAFGSDFQNGSAGGSRIGSLHSGYGSFRRGYGGGRRDNFAGIRGYSSWRQGRWGAQRSVGGY